MNSGAAPATKHFLDTSIVRKFLLGAAVYREYLSKQFGARSCYISIYVEMEIRRSYLRNVIAFFSTLQLPTIYTVNDAITFWSNKFKGSETKAILQLVANLTKTQNLDWNRPADKVTASRVLGFYILRFEAK